MDMEKINAAKLEIFYKAINKLADAEIESIAEQSQSRRTAVGKAKTDFAEREALAQVRSEMNAVAAGFRKEISKCDFEAKKAVLAHRSKLIDGFFSEIGEKLAEFVASPAYEGYLKRSLERASKELSGGVNAVYSAPADVERIKKLTEIEVKADPSIKLGGIIASGMNESTCIDLTLDRALLDEREAFNDKSELRL